MVLASFAPGSPGARRFSVPAVALGIFSLVVGAAAADESSRRLTLSEALLLAGARGVAGFGLAMMLGGAAALGQSAGPDAPGPWQASAFGGWYSGARPYVFRGTFSDEVEFEASSAFGLRLGYDVGSRLGLEVAWTGANPEEAFVSTRRGSIRRLALNTFELNLKVYVGGASVRGFATFGVGGANTGSSFGGANFTSNLGIGVMAFFDPHFGVRVDARVNETYGNIGKDGDPAFCDSAGCYFYKRSWYPSAGVAAGVVYGF